MDTVDTISSLISGLRPSPSTKTTVVIGGVSINAMSVSFGLHNQHGYNGMPQMGALACSVNIAIDMHDTVGFPFSAIKSLFDLVNGVDSSKIQDCKITYWTDETRLDAICVFSFRAWVSTFNANSSPKENHTLHLSLQPELDQGKFIKIDLQN